ncbi:MULTISPECIES: DUF4012 domain-containing protein [unclassified Nocardioides]|uniref:DUF4012 domain-containing protein n=1 Tax=unclassified Nocardioides TaxID=2615069 RepID=UPI000702B455|nr:MULTISPECIES: DUF4012 domain-containing protein [unclassified Nocardioides]KRC53886.1 hypothetical protein ASE19_07325 [Nocardioides sp. Root79]KRC71222.1 hypothetical protein ASE20_09740 [Nocardioides sp. Root240]
MTEEVRRQRRRRSKPLTPMERFRRRLRHVVTGQSRGALVVIGLVVLAVLWVGWTLWSTNRALQEVSDQARVMKAALVRGDAEGARSAMTAYQDAAETAESRTGGPTWSVLELTPLFGDDLKGIEVASDVLADIGRDGLPPIADAADLVAAQTFQPTNGAFPVDRIAAMAGPAQQSERAFDDAASALGQVDSDHFIGPVRGQYEQLRDLVTDARSTLGSTYRAAKIIPQMMGTDRPRYYLMVMQNNAEIRSSGGLPGSLSLVEMKNGRVDIVEQVDMADLGGDTAPVIALTAEEKRIFGQRLERLAVNATLTPDFVRASEIIRARWELKVGGHLDGMFYVDPVAVSYLLRGTGPVNVPGYPAVNAANVVWGVENQIYVLSNDRRVHSAYQEAVAKAVFNAFAAGRGNSVESIRGLVTAVMEGRIRMHSFDPEQQAVIAGTTIAGEFSDEASNDPGVGLYLNDGGPTKMQFYLKYDASIFARSCIGDRQVIAGSIELHSDTPPNAADLPPSITGFGLPGQRVASGDQLVVLYVTTPVGGDVEELSIDGQRIARPVVERLAGRGLARVGILFAPQERHTVEFVLRAGPGQTGDIHLSVTPGAFPGSSNETVGSSCVVR